MKFDTGSNSNGGRKTQRCRWKAQSFTWSIGEVDSPFSIDNGTSPKNDLGKDRKKFMSGPRWSWPNGGGTVVVLPGQRAEKWVECLMSLESSMPHSNLNPYIATTDIIQGLPPT